MLTYQQFAYSKDLTNILELRWKLELDLQDQTGLELTEICLFLSPEYWDFCYYTWLEIVLLIFLRG